MVVSASYPPRVPARKGDTDYVHIIIYACGTIPNHIMHYGC